MQGNFTLFKSDSSGGTSGSADYVKDVFEDVSLDASNNTGLTTNALVNPLDKDFANTDTPLYSNKTLFVKDLILISDRSQWVKNKPTYIVEFTENLPGIFAYVYGNVRLRNQKFGVCVDIKDVGDGFGVTGVARMVEWGFNASSLATASAQAITDSVNGLTLSFNSAALQSANESVNTWYYLKHQAALSTNDIHDYRIEANQYGTLSVGSIQVYFENASANVQFYPGTTYIDKFKSITTVGVGATLPILTGKLGAQTLALKTASNTYSLNTLETPYISSIAVGASGSALIDVATGVGGSFPVGSGLVVPQGTSFYVGSVVSVSTDTLTVTPALDFGISNLIYKAWSGGPTFVIGASLYALRKSVDVAIQNNYLNPDGFIKELTDNYYFSDPEGSYRLWGKDLSQTTIEGYPAVSFSGNTAAFLQMDFKGSALDFEITGNGILNGVLSINGVTSFILNEGMTGIIRKTIMSDGGPGWNSVAFIPGQSFINCGFTKFDIYDRANPGQSLGILSTFETAIDKAYRYTHNASLMSLGPYQRVYGDNLFFSGDWVRGTTSTSAGNVFYAGATNSCVLKFGYYGNDFAIVGAFGTSSVILLDGASIGCNGGQLIQVPGTTFHTVEFQHHAGTCVISALDFSHPQTLELKNTQNYLPRPELSNIPQSFYQSDTPRNARDGALWTKDPNNGPVYIKLGGRWLQIAATATFDDPNGVDLVFVKSHGVSVPNDNTSVTGDTESFNFISWSLGTADTTLKAGASIGDSGLGINLYYVDGYPSGTYTVDLSNRVYNKVAWASGANHTTAKGQASCSALNNKLYFAGGAPADGNIESFTGTAWAVVATVASGQVNNYARGVFTQGGKVHWLGGYDGASRQAHDTFDGSSASTALNVPVISPWTAGTQVGVNGHITGGPNSSTDSYVWDGASWSGIVAAFYGPSYDNAGTAQTSVPSSGYNPNSQLSYVTNGASDATTAVSTSEQFNGVAYSLAPSTSTARSACAGGVF